MNQKYLIIGAGLSGLSTAYFLKNNYLIFEKSNIPGGTAGTFHSNGFKLDNGIHILYFKNPEIKTWIENILRVKILPNKRNCSVWIKDRFIKFPIQYNLVELPFLERYCAFFSIMGSLTRNKRDYKNFEEYSLLRFGKYLTKIFVRPYNEKMFSFQIEKMNTEWMGDYIPGNSVLKMLLGSIYNKNLKYGRNSDFYYPAVGGISTLSNSIVDRLNNTPVFNTSLRSISLNKKIAVFSNGTEISYKYLVNTIPLDAFLYCCDDLSTDISVLLPSLKKNETSILHLFGKGRITVKYHWIYTPEPEIPFYRITVPGNISSSNCPDDHFALTLEFGGNVCNNGEIYKSSIMSLRKMGVLNDRLENFTFSWRLLNTGYIIYDENRKAALTRILPYLREKNIFSIGRYGNWEYSNMEDAIIHGKNTAEFLIRTE